MPGAAEPRFHLTTGEPPSPLPSRAPGRPTKTRLLTGAAGVARPSPVRLLEAMAGRHGKAGAATGWSAPTHTNAHRPRKHDDYPG